LLFRSLQLSLHRLPGYSPASYLRGSNPVVNDHTFGLSTGGWRQIRVSTVSMSIGPHATVRLVEGLSRLTLVGLAASCAHHHHRNTILRPEGQEVNGWGENN
jgi:hypothetical protein